METINLGLPPPPENASIDFSCYSLNMMSMQGIWLDEKPYLHTFPLFYTQVLLILSTTIAIHFILGRLNFPRYISETIVRKLGGFILGPSVLGRTEFVKTLFPERSIGMLESFAYIGMSYYLFLMAVQIDPISTFRLDARMRLVWFSFTCISPPFIIGIVYGLKIHRKMNEGTKELPFILFISLSLSVTAFSMILHNIANMKLAGAELGKLVVSVAIIIDGFAWAALSVVVALSSESNTLLASLLTILSGYGIYLTVQLFVPLLLNRFCRQAVEGTEELGEQLECLILVGVLIAAFLGDFVGEHADFGVFCYGLAIPHGPLGLRLVERVDELVRRMFLPLFFAICCLRTNVHLVNDPKLVLMFLAMVMASGVLRILGGVIVAVAYGMHWHDGVSFGFLMNSKGIIELMMLHVALSKKIIGAQCFSIMVIISIAQTAIVSLLLTFVVKPARHLVHYKRRTVKWHDPGSMLRIIACVHHPHDVKALISLVDFTCPTKKTPVSVSVVQLVELTSRTSAVLLLNNGLLSTSNYSIPLHAQFASVSQAFESYENDAEGVFTQSLTALSPFDTMHEDVIAAANDHHAALVFLPFHMHQAVDGALELTSHPSVRIVNERALQASPCTVAIIVDRGLGGFSQCASILRVVVLFFGGRDDCEALALAGRMVNHPAVKLLVVQIAPTNTNANNTLWDEKKVREHCVDEEYLHEIKVRSGQACRIEYRKTVVANAEETVEAIRMIEKEKTDLFIVGKGRGKTGSKITAGMLEWSEFHELGPIGDLLVSDDFRSKSTVIVIQAPLTTQGFTRSVGSMTLTSEQRKEEVRISMDRT